MTKIHVSYTLEIGTGTTNSIIHDTFVCLLFVNHVPIIGAYKNSNVVFRGVSH